MGDEKQKNNSDHVAFDFSSSYTDNLPKILKALNISLAVTSYQAARFFFIRSDGEKIETHFKYYPRPMGVYADEHRITLGTFSHVLEFKRSDHILTKIKAGELDREEQFGKKLLEDNEKKAQIAAYKKARQDALDTVKNADALYLPRASITTGMINIHDIAWGDEGLWVVNSSFSCLATLSPDYSFIAQWKPPFISELVPEDRCHLNGMAMKDGKPKYVTTFNQYDERDSWVEENRHTGTLIDIDSNDILLEGMIMPHSPRYHKGLVYVCESGTGQVWQYNPQTKQKTELVKVQGFTRGMSFYGDLMFLGLSKARVSKTKTSLPLDEMYDETFSGIWVINLQDGSEIGHIKFEGDVEQLYDIAVIPQSSYPELLRNDSSLIRHIFDYQQG